MRNQQSLKLFLVLLISTAYILAFSQIGALAIDRITGEKVDSENRTLLGTVDVTGLSKDDAKRALEEHIKQWLDQTTITMTYKEVEVVWPLDQYEFNIDQSVDALTDGNKNELVVTIKDLEGTISSLIPSLDIATLDLELLKKQLFQIAQKLTETNVNVALLEYLKDESLNTVAIQEVMVKVDKVPEDLSALIGVTIEVEPQAQLSLVDYLNESNLVLSDESASIMATGVYQAIMPTNFAVIERHIGTEIPVSTKLGTEAKINKENGYDFVFANPNKEAYTLAFDVVNGVVYVRLHGTKLAQSYQVVFKDEQTFKAKIIPQFSPQLSVGQKKIAKQGKEGKYIKVVRQVYDEKGELLKEETLSEDYYAPIHQVEIHPLSIKNDFTSSDIVDEETTEENTAEENPAETVTDDTTTGESREAEVTDSTKDVNEEEAK